MLDDPVLRLIAATCNEVLTGHVWNDDVRLREPVGALAQHLALAASGYAAATVQLIRTAERLHGQLGEHTASLRDRGLVERPHGVDYLAVQVIEILERQELLREVAYDAYRAWRTFRAIPADPNEQHILLTPFMPGDGVATLRPMPNVTPNAWLISVDDRAAEVFGVAGDVSLVGSISEIVVGQWKPTAFTDLRHVAETPEKVYALPAVRDPHNACRVLLRWWHLLQSAAEAELKPERLDGEELAELIR